MRWWIYFIDLLISRVTNKLIRPPWCSVLCQSISTSVEHLSCKKGKPLEYCFTLLYTSIICHVEFNQIERAIFPEIWTYAVSLQIMTSSIDILKWCCRHFCKVLLYNKRVITLKININKYCPSQNINSTRNLVQYNIVQ